MDELLLLGKSLTKMTKSERIWVSNSRSKTCSQCHILMESSTAPDRDVGGRRTAQWMENVGSRLEMKTAVDMEG